MPATDLEHVRRCVELAAEALEDGSSPFGSVLVGGNGDVLFEDRNRVASGDPLHHPELTAVQWAVRNLDAAERRAATVYTSGEHCPMCAAAHGWAGLGRIVYASSSQQLGQWLEEFGAGPLPVVPRPINEIVPRVLIEGPYPELTDAIRDLHRRNHAK